MAEGYKANQKWEALLPHLSDLDAKLESVGYDLTYGLYHDRLSQTTFRHVTTSDCARLVTVPKNATALRTITVEPFLNQFVQQGLNTHLREEITKCSVLSRCLTLNSQEPNQKLALESSRTRDWVTVDLSSASDRLSTELVEAAFRYRPRYLSAILGCRTPSVDTGESVVDLKMYAGMGNATTFPVQSYVFALIALTSMAGTNEVVSVRKLEALASNIRIFGDDIIIRSEYYPGLAEWIKRCGLVINHSKTFTEGNFRESCGVDAWNGHKVTPIYLRDDPSIIATDTGSFVGLLSTCNQLWLQGMYSTSDVLRKLLERVRTLPLVSQTCPGLGYFTHQNLCERQRWSNTLHRFEVKTYVQLPVKVADEIDGYAALMKFFHTPGLAEYDRDHLSRSVRRFNSNLRKRWVPTE